MKSINRFFYGPTPEERVREWRQKLRGEERKLDREIRNVSSDIRSDGSRARTLEPDYRFAVTAMQLAVA